MKSYEEMLSYLADYKKRIDKVKDMGLDYYDEYRDHYIGRCEAVSEMYDKAVLDVVLDVGGLLSKKARSNVYDGLRDRSGLQKGRAVLD